MLPTMFWPIWPSCFRVEDFYKSPNQKQTRIACAGITLGFYVDHDGPKVHQHKIPGAL
jgi:hypothetical protein